MAAQQTSERSREEVLNQATEMARAQGDTFRVKVWHKMLGAPPNLVLSVGAARVQHIADPETWVPPLIGGSGKGVFDFEISHESAPATNVGRVRDIKIGADLRVDRPSGMVHVNWSALDDVEWQGPDVKYPVRPTAVPAAGGEPPLLSIAQGFDGRSAAAAPAAAPSLGTVPPSSFSEDLLRRSEQLADRERKLEVAAVQREAALQTRTLEASFATKFDAISNELRATREALTTIRNTPAAPMILPPPTPPPENPLMKLLTPEVLMLGLKEWAASQKDARAESQRMFESIAKMQADSAKETRDLMLKITEHKEKDGGASSKLVETMMGMQAASFGQMSNLFDLQMRVMKEMQPEDKEESIWKTGLRGLFDYLAATQENEASNAQALAQIAAGQQPTAMANTRADEAPDAAGGGAPPEDDDPEDVEDSAALKRIKTMITEMRPVTDVASLIVNSFVNDREFKEELQDYKYELAHMFDDHLGDWIEADKMRRVPYVQKLAKAINDQFAVRQQEIQNAKAAPRVRRNPKRAIHAVPNGAQPAPAAPAAPPATPTA